MLQNSSSSLNNTTMVQSQDNIATRDSSNEAKKNPIIAQTTLA